MHKLTLLLAVLTLSALAGFGISRSQPDRAKIVSSVSQRPVRSTPEQVVLTPLQGKTKVDQSIARLQQRIRSTPEQSPALLEQLGWTFVEKARISSDPGYYKLAELCADAIEQKKHGAPDGELLRGHIYHALHRFKDAEAVARKLVAQRTFVFDYALLGDALMEQGRLDEAVDAYQRMVDLKPCLQTYSRVAHMRWLKGDLAGAIKAIQFAVGSGSILEPEPVAWAYTRLAFYELEAGDTTLALRATELATQYVPDYAAALLMRGRVLLAQGNTAGAVTALQSAADKSPLPEYLWTLADALRADGKSEQAASVETKLLKTGSVNDPRTFSLYLATRNQKLDVALHLAQEELKNRQDIFTRDALAWAQFASGDLTHARDNMRLALNEGTRDARLFYHAGVIMAAAGDLENGRTYLSRAKTLDQMLLPSERVALEHKIALLPHPSAQVSSR